MRSMHEPRAVEGLIKKLATMRSPEARRDLLVTLIRLYHREADYQGSWSGIGHTPVRTTIPGNGNAAGGSPR